MDYTFFQDNYVWIIVIAVIVVMTIIGYIADKTKFGEKKEKDSKVKPVQELETNEETVVEDSQMDNFMSDEPQMDSFVTEEPQMDNFMTEESTEQEVAFNDNVNTEFEMPVESADEVGFEAFEPVAPLPEEIQEEPIDFEMPMETEVAQNEEVLPETPVETVVEESMDMPVEENINQEAPIEEAVVADEFGLPSIDTLNQEIAEVEEDEDVWKF